MGHLGAACGVGRYGQGAADDEEGWALGGRFSAEMWWRPAVQARLLVCADAAQCERTIAQLLASDTAEAEVGQEAADLSRASAQGDACVPFAGGQWSQVRICASHVLARLFAGYMLQTVQFATPIVDTKTRVLCAGPQWAEVLDGLGRPTGIVLGSSQSRRAWLASALEETDCAVEACALINCGGDSLTKSITFEGTRRRC
jgi:hypothetical protein|eukprot:COSAG01_NODE_486_length_16379_cov_28.208717_2_plen_201_part_00